jgi:hypothetical protein
VVNQSASWFLRAGKIGFFFDIMNAMISLLCLVKLGCFDVERNAFLMVHVQCDREKRREEEKMIPAIPPVYI